jgi:thiol-disulfide isomerase/thioredoxin
MNRIVVMAGLLAFGTSGASAQAVGQVGIPLGSSPEPVVIEDLDGNPVDLAQFFGHKPVLLEFWATWCEQCLGLLPEMIRAYEQFGDEVEFLAVSVAVNQTKRSIERHLNRHPIPFTVLWDTRGRATRALLAPTTSYVAILNADGEVVYTGVGPDQEIVAALEKLVAGSG